MKKIVGIVCSLLIVATLAACGSNVDEETSETYIGKAKEVVNLLNKGEYGNVHAMFNDQMKAGLSEDQMAELGPVIKQSGDFEKIDKASVEEKDSIYVTVLVAKYSKENRVYTISFTEDDKITGLFIQ